MRRSATLLMLALLLVGVPAARADVFLLGFSGFDYESPDANDPDATPVTYLEVGDGYNALGDITSFGPLLAGLVNTTRNEYTYYLFGLNTASHTFSSPFLALKFSNNGRIRHFQDDKATGTHRDFGTNPPGSGTPAPSTFIDGTLMLGGRVDNGTLNYNYGTNQGNFQANLFYDEGANLGVLGGQNSGWVLTGLAGVPNATIPQGYDHQLNGEVRLADVPVSHQTWGAIKSLYR